MKRLKDLPKLETRTVVLLTGLAIGLAIAVHDIFFVVAALIALVIPIESAMRRIHRHATSSNPGAPALVKAPKNTCRVERVHLIPKMDLGCRCRVPQWVLGYLGRKPSLLWSFGFDAKGHVGSFESAKAGKNSD
jgi:hypothetical protein